MKKVKKKKHKHKWKADYADCPFCGGGEYAFCADCGEERMLNKKQRI